MTESELIEKLLKIERLFAGAATDGERAAAAQARDRVRKRLCETVREPREPEVEYKFCLDNRWSWQLFVALARKHGLSPYRYSRQRRTTVMLKMQRSFLDEIFWPEYLKLSGILHDYISEITGDVIRKHIHGDSSDVNVVDTPAIGG